MGFFDREEPGLRDLVAYVVARALGRETSLSRTKLVKLLYLVDVEQLRRGRSMLTDLPWVFFHYGPYAFPLADQLERMEDTEIHVRRLSGDRARNEVVLYVGAPTPPDADSEWPATTRMLVNRVVDQWAAEPLNALLDYVYFQTEPMTDAVRGEPLNMGSVQRVGITRYRPLPAPAPLEDADQRLAKWLERRRKGRLAGPIEPANYDENYWRLMRVTSGYPDGDPGNAALASGGLAIADDVDL